MNKAQRLWHTLRIKFWRATHEVAVIQDRSKKYIAICRKNGGKWREASYPLVSKAEAQSIAENLPLIVSPHNR